MKMEPRKVLTDLVTSEKIDKALKLIKSNPELTVEGCHYEIAREERHQDLVNFIRDQFIPDEPLEKSVAHLIPNTVEMEAFWMKIVQQNLSLVLISDSTGEIIAIRVNAIGKKTSRINSNDVATEGFRKVIDLTKTLRKLGDVYDHYNVEEVIHFLALGVHRDYRRRGIGLKIMKAAVELVKGLELNGVIIKGEGSSKFSKKIYEKVGFDIFAEIVYEEYKENGEVVFKNMGDHKSVRQYGKFVC